MRLFSFLLIFPLLSANVYSQRYVETLVHHTGNYNPLFKNESATLDMSLVLTYTYGKRDSAMLFIVYVSQQEYENVSASISIGLIGSSGFGGASSSYKINKDTSRIVMGLDSLMSFIDAVSVIKRHSRAKHKNETQITKKGGGIVVGANLPGNRMEEIKYFLQLGSATFLMSYDKFEYMFSNLQKSLNLFREFENEHKGDIAK